MLEGKVIREGSIDELTPRTGNARFVLREVPEGIEKLLDGLGTDFARLPTGFDLKVNDEELDQTIDRLRAASVGIREIARRRLTLEESFIHLVNRRGA
jgi:hypothetical protein